MTVEMMEQTASDMENFTREWFMEQILSEDPSRIEHAYRVLAAKFFADGLADAVMAVGSASVVGAFPVLIEKVFVIVATEYGDEAANEGMGLFAEHMSKMAADKDRIPDNRKFLEEAAISAGVMPVLEPEIEMPKPGYCGGKKYDA